MNWRSARQAFTATLCTWGVAGLVFGTFVGAWTGRLNLISPWSRDGLTLALLIGGGYTIAGLALGGAAGLLVAGTALFVRAITTKRILSISAGLMGFATSATMARWGSEGVVSPASAVAALAIGLGSAIFAHRAQHRFGPLAWRSRVGICPALILVALALGAALPSGLTVVDAGGPQIPPPSIAHRPGRRVILLGLDALDPVILDRLMDSGRLPNFARLRGEGAHGRLGTYRPAYSPVIWTTILTGHEPARHGIFEFTFYRFPGVRAPVQRFPHHLGTVRLFELFRRLGIASRIPVSGLLRRTRALWDILSQEGKRVAIVNWWATWPAEPVNGTLVTDRFFYGLSGSATAPAITESLFPSNLWTDMRRQAVLPTEISDEEMRRFFDPADSTARALDPQSQDAERVVRRYYASDQTHLRIARQLLARESPDFTAVLLQGVDAVSHMMGRDSFLWPGNKDPDRRRRYGRALEAYYAYFDEVLGQIMSEVDSKTVLLVCSDHGFEWHGGRFDHVMGPPGVFMMYGEGTAPAAAISSAHVRDLTPIILSLLGLPVGRDMRGIVPVAAFRAGALAGGPTYIASYEGGARRSDMRASDVDEEAESILRSLGYVN